LATAEFATLRLRLLKIAARVVETTSRIRLAFAKCFEPAIKIPDKAIVKTLSETLYTFLSGPISASCRSSVEWSGEGTVASCSLIQPTKSPAAISRMNKKRL